MDKLGKVLGLAFGSDWKTSLAGMAAAAIAGAVAYAGGHSEPGFYILALGLAAVGRWAAHVKKTE